MNLREAAQQALEALEYYQHRRLEWDYSDEAAITALRAALAQDALRDLAAADREIEGALAQPVSSTDELPAAWLYQHGETGRNRIVLPEQQFTNAPGQWLLVGPLYLHPPASGIGDAR